MRLHAPLMSALKAIPGSRWEREPDFQCLASFLEFHGVHRLLQVISMEGFGCDAYLHLNRLGNVQEPLP